MNFCLLFREAKLFNNGYLAHGLSERNEIWPRLGVWPIETYSPNFMNFGPVIPCGDMHQSFTDALVKWFFDNFPWLPIVLDWFLFTALPKDD